MTPSFRSELDSADSTLPTRSHAPQPDSSESVSVPAIEIATVTAQDLLKSAPVLAELLADVVDESTLGFVPPVQHDVVLRYFISLHNSLERGDRVIVVARDQGQIVGSGQLALSPWPNSRHRAEVQKVFVARSHQGRGVARRIMRALHQAARDRGLSLLTLGTRSGASAVHLYTSLGYTVAGVIPGYMLGPSGERLDSVTMYLELR